MAQLLTRSITVGFVSMLPLSVVLLATTASQPFRIMLMDIPTLMTSSWRKEVFHPVSIWYRMVLFLMARASGMQGVFLLPMVVFITRMF